MDITIYMLITFKAQLLMFVRYDKMFISIELFEVPHDNKRINYR